MKRLLLVGNDGFCGSVIDSLGNQRDEYDIGIVSTNREAGRNFEEINIVGTIDDLSELYQKGYNYAFISEDSNTRKFLFEKAKAVGYSFVNIIDSSAVIASNAKIGEGVFIGKKVTIDTGSTIEDNCLVNTACSIGYNSHIGENCNLSTASTIGNDVTIESDCYIAPRSVVGDQIKLKSGTKTEIMEVVMQ